MTIQGLLVENHKGKDFLLTTESCPNTNTHRLIVLQRINGTWNRLTGMEERTSRESLIGAFVDFFVDICQVLNSAGTDAAPTSLPRTNRTNAGALSHPILRSVQ